MNTMKKFLMIAALAVIPMLAATPAQAIPMAAGTVNLNFSTGGSTTMDWAVYAPGASGALAGVSAVDYTYQYTLHGWSGYAGSFFSDIGTGSPANLNTIGSSPNGTGATVPVQNAPVSDYYLGSAFFFDTHGGTMTGPANTTIGWYTSALGPVKTWIAGNLTGVTTPGATPPTYTAGFGLDSQIILGAGVADIKAIPLAPGVPEPETWALLLAMMGFATWWMRRRQDDDAPMETSISA